MSNETNKILMLVFIPLVIFVGYLIFKTKSVENKDAKESIMGANVLNVEGKQIIELKAKGGYFPESINAAADKDTILRVITKGTFDCSSAIAIPKLGIRKSLPHTAVTDIPLGTQKSGTTLAGTCAMGMYNFSLSFN